MPLQTNVLEFLVSGSLDGVTPNAPFQRADAVQPPRPDPPGTDPENIYQFEVEDLGVIDLSFPGLVERLNSPVTTGNRYIPWLMIDTGGVVAPIGAGVNVAAFRPGGATPVVQKVAEPLDGSTGIYTRRCIFVSHGSTLQLGTVAANAGIPIIVRFAVLLPTTRTEEELIVKACCCLTDISPTEPTTCMDPPDPQDVTPNSIPNDMSPTTIQIDGDSFQDGDTVTITGLVVNSTTFVSDTQLDAEIIPSDAGTYNILVSRPGENNCTGLLSGGLTVT